MIYTTFEQIEYGFVLFNNFKKHLDINRFRKYKIERFGPNRPLQCYHYSIIPIYIVCMKRMAKLSGLLIFQVFDSIFIIN